MKNLTLFSVTLFEFLSTSTRTYIIASYSNIFLVFLISCLDDSDSFTVSFFVLCMSHVACRCQSICIELRFCRFCIFREECLLEIDLAYRLMCFCREESLRDPQSDRLDQCDELGICSFLVDDERILLCISFESHFFPKMSHTVYMEHPEFINSGE